MAEQDLTSSFGTTAKPRRAYLVSAEELTQLPLPMRTVVLQAQPQPSTSRLNLHRRFRQVQFLATAELPTLQTPLMVEQHQLSMHGTTEQTPRI